MERATRDAIGLQLPERPCKLHSSEPSGAQHGYRRRRARRWCTWPSARVAAACVLLVLSVLHGAAAESDRWTPDQETSDSDSASDTSAAEGSPPKSSQRELLPSASFHDAHTAAVESAGGEPGGSGEDAEWLRHAPEHLLPWAEYALEMGCPLARGYEAIYKDLEPFREAGITLEQIETVATSMEAMQYCRVRDGEIKCEHEDPVRFPKLDAGFLAVVARLPDMDFLLNWDDHPRVMNVRETGDGEPLPHCKRQRTGEKDWTDWNMQVPLLSPCALAHGKTCDILLPATFNRPSLMMAPPNVPLPSTAWESKASEVRWHGSTTGADIRNGQPWREAPRFRLMKLANEPGAFGDGVTARVSFNAIVQCYLDPRSDCDVIKQEYGIGQHYQQTDFFSSKFIIDIDGNAWSARFERLMISGSVIVKATEYRSWWSERAKPWVHYVPVNLDLSNLQDTIKWLHANDDIAKRIGEAARMLALTKLRDNDLDCYLYRVLLEYSRLFK